MARAEYHGCYTAAMTLAKRYFEKIIDTRFILENEPMSKHTTFKTGGPADFLLIPQNESQLIECIRLLRDNNENFFVMGRGSNLLVSDAGYRGTVVKISYGKAASAGDTLYADAGANLKSVAFCAMENSLSGLEFAAGIPGSLGGGAIMNAGAYGSELKDFITGLRVLDHNLKITDIPNADAGFSYRHSLLGEKGFIVLGASFKLCLVDKKEISQKMEDLAARRREKQPLEFPSAGSTFKRPPGGYAGALIEKCGLKGKSIGGAQVSEKHAGFIINTGSATSTDIYRLISYMRKAVHARTGINLEPEVRLLGEYHD